MKLGLVRRAERLADSPDTVVIVEPTIGATARSKGSLFLVVTARAGPRLREATHLVAETIRREYYYDESAGLVVCLEKAIRAANRRSSPSGTGSGLGDGPTGPIGVGLAVVRGNELYVVTTGPAEAYLVRQAHLLTLPDADPRPAACRSTDLAPEVWRGEIAVGDSLVLVSSNLTREARPGRAQGRRGDAPPAGGDGASPPPVRGRRRRGSDAAIAFEATEVSATTQQRPPRSRAAARAARGPPDRSPIPLADSVGDGLAAVSSGASRARSGRRQRARPGRLDRLAGPAAAARDPLSAGHARRDPARVAAPGRGRGARVRRRGRRLLGIGLWVIGGTGGTDQDPADHRRRAARSRRPRRTSGSSSTTART